MAKWRGVIGYAEMVEREPGIWEEEITERAYSGDMNQNIRRLQSADKLNDDITVTNEISIVADPFARLNFHKIRYAEYMGTMWKINSATVNYPRLVLTMGGVYNGNQARPAE